MDMQDVETFLLSFFGAPYAGQNTMEEILKEVQDELAGTNEER